MVLLGCKPKGRFTEQHDVFFGIANSLKELVPQMNACWPEAKNKLHIDAWREVNFVDGYQIAVTESDRPAINAENLFFINLGGYKENEFDEFHYKMLVVAETLALATKKAKETAFYKHNGFKGATSHIDDKYGIDVDDLYKVSEILDTQLKQKYYLSISKTENTTEDKIHLGYFIFEKL